MTRFALCLVLGALANGCAISASVGSGPVAPAGPNVAYLPPGTAHSPPAVSPAPQPAAPAAAPMAPPAVEAAPQPARPSTAPVPQPAPARADYSPPRPAGPPAVRPSHEAPQTKHPPQKKKKLRFKDIWVEQAHPDSVPQAEPPPRRVVSQR